MTADRVREDEAHRRRHRSAQCRGEREPAEDAEAQSLLSHYERTQATATP